MRVAPLPLCCIFAVTLLLGCHKSAPPKTGKAKRDETSQRQSSEREAVENFASAIRAVVEWNHAQPPPKDRAAHAALVKEFARRLHAIPVQDLPPEVLQAWKDLNKSCEHIGAALDKAAPPSADEMKALQTEGRKAGEKLNEWLDSQGFGELHF